MTDIFNYSRRKSSTVKAGNCLIGGDNPIRLQSMTTTNTNDTEASVEQAIRIIKAGGELVRLTTQGTREALNMGNIRYALRCRGYSVPLVADVHFNANVADVAAEHCDKVRINPGNYTDPARKFRHIEYTDEEYAAELQKIEERLVPFIDVCRRNNTAVRIGVNHGSLSDRIMSRYGDTPEGIVESCMEFLRIFNRHDFHNVVISIKASNTVIMVKSVRLLSVNMEKENMSYPIHLGVTEAGEGEDGRIKSAVGIGALLTDGIGDTIRVSLSEEPEAEIPVARHLANYVTQRANHTHIPATIAKDFNWVNPSRRHTDAVGNIGGNCKPVVIASNLSDQQPLDDLYGSQQPDYIYIGDGKNTTLKPGVHYIVDFNSPLMKETHEAGINLYPIFPHTAMPFVSMIKADRKFLVLQYGAPTEEYVACLKHHPEIAVVCITANPNRPGEQRAFVHELMEQNVTNPVIFCQHYKHNDTETSLLQLEAAADMGALMIDGLTDGIWLMNHGDIPTSTLVSTSFAILQAARLRVTKTEYISCPGCGRTMYDLQSTIKRIKDATSHLAGLKIGIMGCIVNGPGEMADADYGYVGAGKNRISLYKGKECVEKNIPEEEAVDHLIQLIQKNEKQC